MKDTFLALWSLGAMLTAFDMGVVLSSWCAPSLKQISRPVSALATAIWVVLLAATWPVTWLSIIWGRRSVRRMRKAGKS